MSENFDEENLEILACPHCKGNLELKEGQIVCKDCSREYPIEDGIPNMLPDSMR